MMGSRLLAGSALNPTERVSRGEHFTRDGLSFSLYNASNIRVSFLRPQGAPTAGGSLIAVHGAGFLADAPDAGASCSFVGVGNSGNGDSGSGDSGSGDRGSGDRGSGGSGSGDSGGSGGSGDSDTGSGDSGSGGSGSGGGGGGGGSGDSSTSDAIRVVVPASYLNAHLLHCVTPPGLQNGIAALEVSFDGQRYTDDALGVELYTLAAVDGGPTQTVSLSELQPIGGPARGGTPLTLLGVGFRANGGDSSEAHYGSAFHSVIEGPTRAARVLLRAAEPPPLPATATAGLLCVFLRSGGNGTAEVAAVAAASAINGSDTSVSCRTPALGVAAGSAHESYTVAISLNGRSESRTAALLFSVYRDDAHVQPRLLSVQPFGGPVGGGTAVHIAATRLRTLIAHASPTCRFGTLKPVAATITAADGDAATVRCVSPARASTEPADVGADVSLTVAQNAHDDSSRPLRFRYYTSSSARLSALLPRGGPLRQVSYRHG